MKIFKYPGIYLERFINEPISLEYINVISIFTPGYLASFFYSCDSLDYEKYANTDYPGIWYISPSIY